eukprot:TRINITY_DN76341_c0_g1_i1.p1 TRINITY_DN76341_c0_g1~~TRINITY_DN76341_c0_g1_i1.p1  ORF type:complete len:224 (-),score=27.86 TRINITY_DN76341_c0_g1_i1:83-754(-)
MTTTEPEPVPCGEQQYEELKDHIEKYKQQLKALNLLPPSDGRFPTLIISWATADAPRSPHSFRELVSHMLEGWRGGNGPRPVWPLPLAPAAHGRSSVQLIVAGGLPEAKKLFEDFKAVAGPQNNYGQDITEFHRQMESLPHGITKVVPPGQRYPNGGGSVSLMWKKEELQNDFGVWGAQKAAVAGAGAGPQGDATAYPQWAGFVHTATNPTWSVDLTRWVETL